MVDNHLIGHTPSHQLMQGKPERGQENARRGPFKAHTEHISV